jgi:hypothetical protein
LQGRPERGGPHACTFWHSGADGSDGNRAVAKVIQFREVGRGVDFPAGVLAIADEVIE